jgi:hypothetical protein
MNVLELGDRTLLEMDGRLVEPIKLAFDKYLFAEQVKMRSLIGASHELALYGPGAGTCSSQPAARQSRHRAARIDADQVVRRRCDRLARRSQRHTRLSRHHSNRLRANDLARVRRALW